VRPPCPNLRSFDDPEGPFLTYHDLRAQLHPAPAEQTLAIPRAVVIHDPFAESFTRAERRWLESE
jgi:hypothetical protein